MAVIFPTIENILRLKVPPTDGELYLVKFLKENLDDSYEIFFNPFLDGDRPDIIILKQGAGAFVVEIKDWELRHYDVDHANQWYVNDSNRRSKIPSPQSQSFRYKKNLYELHLPVVGLAILTNPNFYNLVHCFVYFHGASVLDINQLYSKAETNLAEQQRELNLKRKNSQVSDHAYNSKFEFLSRKKTQIQRDKSIAIAKDSLNVLIKKIEKQSKHVLFDDNVYKDFKRRLSPSEHTLKQGIELEFDKKQKPLTASTNGKAKIKGVAGCGKTSVLAQRAVNARSRHMSEVLVLTFNITLKNYIKDKISDIQGKRDLTLIEISNYHQFFNSQVNNTGQAISQLISEFGIEGVYKKNVFEGCDVPKYKTILLDEIQDYESDWVKIIRDNFLDTDGEMVLLGDESQDIYHRNSGRAQVIAQGFGTWNKLTRSYRTDFDSPLNQLFKNFQLEYLAEKFPDPDLFETPQIQMGIGFTLLKYQSLQVDKWQDAAYQNISSIISSYELVPNDVVILSSSIYEVRKLNALWIEHEKTSCMFDTYDELVANFGITKEKLQQFTEHEINKLIHSKKKVVDRIRRTKKNHFYANSGLIKLSTIHSFKGLEAKTVFYLLQEEDDAEMVYTALTRSTENLIVLDLGGNNKCSEFLKDAISD